MKLTRPGCGNKRVKLRQCNKTPENKNVVLLRPYLAAVVRPMNELPGKTANLHGLKNVESHSRKQISCSDQNHYFAQYEPNLAISIALDGSPYDISGILSHVMPDGSEKKTDCFLFEVAFKTPSKIRSFLSSEFGYAIENRRKKRHTNVVGLPV